MVPPRLRRTGDDLQHAVRTSSSSLIATAVASGAGLSTTALPNANAGAAFHSGFVWTKTADEILAKAKPRQKTSNTRHSDLYRQA